MGIRADARSASALTGYNRGMVTGLRLRVLPFHLAVCRLPADALFPSAALTGAFFSVTRTADELSLIVIEGDAPADAVIERGWRAIQVAGPLDFSLTGILSSLAAPLADAGIPIFAISTFDTDYLLVKDDRLRDSVMALRAKGHFFEGDHTEWTTNESSK